MTSSMLTTKLARGRWTPDEVARLMRAVGELLPEVVTNTGKSTAAVAGTSTSGSSTSTSGSSTSTTISTSQSTTISMASTKVPLSPLPTSTLGAWTGIAACVGTRTNVQCYQKFMRSSAPQLMHGRWEQWEDERLLKGVRELGGGNWAAVARYVMGNQRTADGCRARYMLLDDQRMRLHNNATWSKEEHRRLAEMAASGKLKAATGAERGKAQRKVVAKQQVFIANANVEAESETTRPLPAPPLSPWSNAAMAVGTRSPLQCLNHFYGSMLHKQLKLRRSESV